MSHPEEFKTTILLKKTIIIIVLIIINTAYISWDSSLKRSPSEARLSFKKQH